MDLAEVVPVTRSRGTATGTVTQHHNDDDDDDYDDGGCGGVGGGPC